MLKAAGIIFQASNQILLLKRSNEGDHAGEWAFVGGKIEDGETAQQAAIRETAEETGYIVNDDLVDLSRTESSDGVDYTTFTCAISEEFIPSLNDEHTDFQWIDAESAAKLPDLHPAVKETLIKLLRSKIIQDSEFKESDHPRDQDGKFSGSEISATDHVEARKIEPVHEPREIGKLNNLAKSMQENGWVGRPIPVFEGAYGITALTGSHRIAAAKMAGIDVPVYEIEGLGDFVDENNNTISDIIGNGHPDDLVKFLEEFGDKDAKILAEIESKNTGIRHDSDKIMNELDIARGIRSGSLSSPQAYQNITLFDLRISGTGVSYRSKLKEFCYRNPSNYLNNDFLERCQGLPVILEHPEDGTLDSKQFTERSIGTIMLPYIKGDEVWGVAKIYDAPAAQMMAEDPLSTSPSVVLGNTKDQTQELEDGTHLLIEGIPALLDHLAIVEVGVWDKGGSPTGVKNHAEKAETTRSDSGDLNESIKGATTMPDLKKEEPKGEEVKKADEGATEGIGEVLALLKSMDARLGKLEGAEVAEVKKDELPSPDLKTSGDNAKPSPEIAAMQKRIDDLEGQLPKSDDDGDAAKFADAQARADAVAAIYGDSARRPMRGETLLAYRISLAAKYQSYSPEFKDVKLSAINDGALLNMIEKKIYADAAAAASDVSTIKAGSLRERTSIDLSGRKITEFDGSPSAWTNQFKAPKRRLVGINKQF